MAPAVAALAKVQSGNSLIVKGSEWLNRLDGRVFPRRSTERTRAELWRLVPLIAAVAVGVPVAADARRALVHGSGFGTWTVGLALSLAIMLAFLIVFSLIASLIAARRARTRSEGTGGQVQ